MRLIFTTLLVCIYSLLSAQTVQQQKTDSAAQLIREYYNKKDAAGIYAMAGENFRKALSQEALGKTIEQLHTQIGTLSAIELESYANNVAKYKALFANITMSLFVGLNDKEMLETFLLREYEQPVALKKEKVLSTNPLATAFDKLVDSVVQEYMSKDNTIGLALGLLENGKTLVYGYGETVKGSKQIPHGNTLFEIGSISKTFTATLLANFVVRGKLKLYDPVNNYLPDSIPKLEFDSKPVTIQSLSNHSSGLPRLPGDLFFGAVSANPYKHYDDKKLFTFLKNYKPSRGPGAQYEYSNLAVGLLGVILERISRKSYEQLLQEIIWKPLQMNNTRVTLLKNDSAKFAQGYDARAIAVPSWEFQSLAGAGAIRSTVNDMLLFAKAQLHSTQKTNLQKAIALTHRQTYESGQTRVALGWHFINNGGKEYIGHNGQTGGYASVLIFQPSSGRAIVILTNASVAPAPIALPLLNGLDKL